MKKKNEKKERKKRNSILSGILEKAFRMPFLLITIMGIFFLILVLYAYILKPSMGGTLISGEIVGIRGECEQILTVQDTVLPEYLKVYAVYDNGREFEISAEDYTIISNKLSFIGDTTNVPIYLNSDTNIKGYAEVRVQREKVVSFTCGYPATDDVKAVLYSNGELRFEGRGDILVFDEGNMPWSDYEVKEDYPIYSISFEDTVTPTNIDYICKGLETLQYVDTIPNTVVTMYESFADCPNLKATGDWSKCTNLLDITRTYASNTSLQYIYPLPMGVTNATECFAYCENLSYIPDMNAAVKLIECKGMFKDNKRLVEGVIPVNAEDISSMYENCINLHIAPIIPSSVKDMTNTFMNNYSLVSGPVIPSTVEKMSQAFAGCGLLEGTLEINSNTEDAGGIFDSACNATVLQLIGDSSNLAAYAETNQYNHIIY